MITYYAKAKNAAGKIEQILVTMDHVKRKTQWTGKVYRTDREADADITALNVEIAKKTRDRSNG